MPTKRPFDSARFNGTQPAEVRFIAALDAYQLREHLTDAAFVARLGVSLALWRHTRSGRAPLGEKLWSGGADLVGYDLAAAAHAALRLRARQRWSRNRRGEEKEKDG